MRKKDIWIRNLLVAHVVMTEMPNNGIAQGLAIWCTDTNECGSPACFGGWIARIPYFQKQGVSADWLGQPITMIDGVLQPEDASTRLFGEYLFSGRSTYSYIEGNPRKTDRQVILHRIEKQINTLLQ